jgi:hypothetical protein
MCGNSFLHKFKIEEEYTNGVLEVCEICFLRKFFKVLDNKLDNREYMSWHLKQALPYHHPMYNRQHENPIERELIRSPYAGK